MALTLTEDLIRSRVSLSHDNLEDVKSISLPGTYHEKIVSIGNSLRKFSRLKSLDLSRNALDNLEGLENLKLLEKLNLYYNNINSLEELKRLKLNTSLKELDLRLNPITRSEPDSRLYLIHMLPSLQKLDDRGVRDRERQAALVHFSSSQATEMTHHPPEHDLPKKTTHPRAEFVNKLQKRPTVLDDDDVAVLDLIAHTGGDLAQPRPLTGSAARQDKAEEYTLDGLKSLDSDKLNQTDPPRESRPDKKAEGRRPRSSSVPDEDEDVMSAYRKRYPNIPNVLASDGDRGGDRRKRADPNLEYADEMDAYTKYRSHGYFTPHPGADEDDLEVSQVPTERESYPEPPRMQHERGSEAEQRLKQTGQNHHRNNSAPRQNAEIEETLQELGIPKDLPQDPRQTQEENAIKVRLEQNPQGRELLFRLMDLVDRYWNGTKSLHKNAKFKGLALNQLEKVLMGNGSVPAQTQREVHHLHEQLQRLKDDNIVLRDRDARNKANLDGSSANETHLKNSLQKAYQDVETLRDQLDKYVSENRRLAKKLDSQETFSSYQGGAASSMSTVNQTQLDDLQRQNDALQREIEGLRGRLKQFAQMQELANMLQDSHKSLVQTNDHLLKEMSDTRHRHMEEVKQLHWSYDQLKKTMSYLPSHNNSSVSAGRYTDTEM
ncbi:centrosomal protein of 72 kDa-like [Haliotis rufescens]|uniref:centrosomal protein of 72 kDa-like n=1 Tax=Haliotis rufescens TaxID=6454 RepID=UPI00201F2AC1|nr:centrosomal protein of 72 kDa-like [Haliotis rufescens]